jgi:hypothetical protein
LSNLTRQYGIDRRSAQGAREYQREPSIFQGKAGAVRRSFRPLGAKIDIRISLNCLPIENLLDFSTSIRMSKRGHFASCQLCVTWSYTFAMFGVCVYVINTAYLSSLSATLALLQTLCCFNFPNSLPHTPPHSYSTAISSPSTLRRTASFLPRLSNLVTMPIRSATLRTITPI